MRVRLLVVSHRPPSWVVEGAAEYERRLPREWRFELVELKPGARTAGQPSAKVRAEEGGRLRAAVPKGACVVALDEGGEPWSSAQLAERLRRWLQQGRDLAFVVGGADGLDPELLRTADQRWSLSALTLPHGLVRVMVVEQLYRAASLLAGHPYHRA